MDNAQWFLFCLVHVQFNVFLLCVDFQLAIGVLEIVWIVLPDLLCIGQRSCQVHPERLLRLLRVTCRDGFCNALVIMDDLLHLAFGWQMEVSESIDMSTSCPQ